MTGDSDLFLMKASHNCLPLFEGKMMHQFTSTWGEPRYWVNEEKARDRLLKSRIRELNILARNAGVKLGDEGEICLDYKQYRLAFRNVGPATNERSMIMTVLPRNVFCPHSLSLEKVFHGGVNNGKVEFNRMLLSDAERLFVCAVMNSFVIDEWLRKSVTKNISFFYVYATPVPRLTSKDSAFAPIVKRSAQLICTTPEFDALTKEVSAELKLPLAAVKGVTDPAARARLRAELDGLIAHLYGLTESEFAYILTTFPLVTENVKLMARNAFRDVQNGLIK
jgi:hypothetical protein